MRLIPTVLLASLLLVPIPATADDGRPHQGDACKDREHTCTDVSAGGMTCMPPAGTANDLAVVVGSADSGTFKLEAKGTSDPINGETCMFEIRILTDEITFNEGYSPGILAPYGGASNVGWSPCFAAPGTTCTAEASFSWWRAQHGVTFDVPFVLLVNGIEVARGECHYFDPPMMESVTGGPLSV